MEREITKQELESLRAEFSCGTRVELVQMNDVQAPPPGTRGTVQYVDDIGTIHVKWDNGSSLGLAYGEDACKTLRERSCPRCKTIYTDPPALSRRDNQTFLCPDCGIREALEDAGYDAGRRETALAEILKARQEARKKMNS